MQEARYIAARVLTAATCQGLGRQFNINCGGNAVGRFISERQSWIRGTTFVNPGDFVTSISGAEAKNAVALTTHRWSKFEWGYDIPVDNPGEYSCSLHFAETSDFFSQSGKRIFDIQVMEKGIKKVDVFREAGGPYTSLVKTFNGLQVSDTLRISLKPVTGDPFLSAITCILDRDVSRPIPTQKLGKEFNINCGGPAKGRFIADNLGWVSGNTAESIGTNRPILGAERQNEPALNTHRWGRGSSDWSYNIPIQFPGIYECSLHFAEISPFFFESGKRVFNVQVMDQKVSGVDIFSETGGEYRSLVKTFRGLRLEDSLQIQLKPVSGDAIVSAITCVYERRLNTDTDNVDSDFSRVTFRASTQASATRIEDATDGSGDKYEISYNVRVAQEGVVSLSSLRTEAGVKCAADGTVRVTLSQNAPIGPTVQSMYPRGAVLVIEREVFGECLLGPLRQVPGESNRNRDLKFLSEPKASLFRDGYLLIDTVSGTVRDAVIQGTATTFFALFDDASINVLPIAASSALVRTSQTEHVSGRNLSLPFASRKKTILPYPFEHKVPKLGPLDMSIKGTVDAKGAFQLLKAEWDIKDLDVELRFTNFWEVKAALDAEFEKGLFKFEHEVPLVSIPVYALPPIEFLELKESDFLFPKFKLGIFLEMPLTLTLEGKLKAKMTNVASLTARSPNMELSVFFRGPFLKLDIGSRVRELAPAFHSFDSKPDVDGEVELIVSGMLRPQIVAYAHILSARASFDTVLEIKASFDAPSDSAFAPIADKQKRTFGICDQCHDVQVSTDAKIQDAGIFVVAGIDLRAEVFRRNLEISREKTIAEAKLPIGPLVLNIATGCFVKPGGGKELHFLDSKDKCEACPDDKPNYNPTRKECEGECPTEKPFFNQATQQCEACPRELPVFNTKLEICESKCPGGKRAGDNEPFYGSFELGSKKGVFNVRREHYTVRDRMQVFYEGKVVYDTGCVGGQETVAISYDGEETNVVVAISPRCGGTRRTRWNFSISCPA